MNGPRLSILIPTYNRANLLLECLQSIRTVSVDCEIVVVDNASTDHTRDVVRECSAVDPRIRYICNERNIGLMANYNRALQEARGTYICMLGDDDLVLPGNFEKKVPILDAHPEIGFVYSLWYRIDEHGNNLGVCFWPGLVNVPYVGGRPEFFDLLPACYIALQSVVFRRILWEQLGGIEEERLLYVGDWDLLLRYCYHMSTAFINEPLVAVRVHPQRTTEKIRGQGYFARGRLALWRKWLVENDNPPVLDESRWHHMSRAFLPDLRWEFGNDAETIRYYLDALETLKRESLAKISLRFRNSVTSPQLPRWWVKLWQRLQRGAPGSLLCLGVNDSAALGVIARDGWRVYSSVSQGSDESAPQSFNSVAVFGQDWTSLVDALQPGGAFLVGIPVRPEDILGWRATLEEAFHATVHLVDPEPESPWLFAFGWKGRRLPSIRRSVLMVAHQRALQMFGGGETQLLETLFHLGAEGVRADVSVALRLPTEQYDLLHVFSLYHAEKIEALTKLQKPVVTSTIFWDYAELRHANSLIRAIFSQPDDASVRRALDAWRTGQLHVEGLSLEQTQEPPNVRATQRAVIARSQLLLPNSHREVELLERTFGRPLPATKIVPNAVRPEIFLHAKPDAFVQRFNLRDFVLCAGRVEPNKNQLMLIWALRGTDLPLVLAGAESDPGYASLCRQWAGKNVHWVGELSQDLLASAYAAARVHALPSWSETPGLVNLEAAIAGCALVVSNRGAESEYLGEHAFVCDPGDPESIRAAVLRAWQDTDARRREARRRHILAHYTWDRTAKATATAYEEAIANKLTPAAPDRSPSGDIARALAITWEGSQFVHHSLALVNREVCLQLIRAGHEVSIIPYEPHQFGPELDGRFTKLTQRFMVPLSRPADVHVRHQWPPNFTPPPEGHWVIIQPWEYGTIPRRWVEVMATEVDEVWVPSHYVRNCYILSGVPADRVHVVPNGVDPECFHPQAPPLDLSAFGASHKEFRFLFVGGTIMRKGIDVLLQAYGKAFTRADDVCLVIKDMGNRSFYRGQTWEQTIRELQSTPESPRIVYIDQDLSPTQLPGLYTACDCLVHPYRGEGFGLPIAEAMACGLPVIVTGYGAAMDFCDSETAYLIPAVVRKRTDPGLMALEPAGNLWLAEPDDDALARLMRHVYEHRDEARFKGRKASERIRTGFTWQRAADTALARMRVLKEQPIRRHQPAAPVAVGNAIMQGPLVLAETRSVHLLMMPDWNDPEDRWQDALRAFVREFGPDEDVGLVVRVDPLETPNQEAILQRIERWADAERINLDADPLVLILNDLLDPTRRDLVYDTAQILVDLSDSARGRAIRSEAMAHGLVICPPSGSDMRSALDAVRTGSVSQRVQRVPQVPLTST